jgi:hypothetical protein
MAPRVPLLFVRETLNTSPLVVQHPEQGTMTLGHPGKNGVRTSDKAECQDILNTYFQFGKELDTARMYAEGTTERVCAMEEDFVYRCNGNPDDRFSQISIFRERLSIPSEL